jgi:F-type H+-transporting ATPase subunit epsilon
MYLEILTPNKTVFSGRVKSVTLPGTKSPFTILKQHAPLISTLDNGELGLETDTGGYLLFTIDQGIVEVRENRIVVLVEKIRTAEL